MYRWSRERGVVVHPCRFGFCMLLRGPSRPDLLREECLGDILRATAQRRPHHPALIWGDQQVTYGELDAQSDALAIALQGLGAAAERHVGLYMPRGAELLIAQAAIAKSGASWLPMDANTPPQRVDVCLKVAGACGLLTTRACAESLKEISVPVWYVEDLRESTALTFQSPSPGEMVAAEERITSPTSTRPAYAIFTSGSTGVPKGIVVTHRSICHFLRSENEVLGITEDDRVYQGFSVAFDMSFEEIWISYLVGATLWIAPPDCVADPEQIAAAVKRHRITVVHAVPTLMGLIDDPLPTVRLINLGGEACPDALVDRLTRPGRKLFNTYGPTEATVSATLETLLPGRPVTIGEPLPNYGVLLLNGEMQPLPQGATGEICLFGPGVAVGYLGQPELTNDKFIANPAAENLDEARMYRTGDLGRIDERGRVHYLGRADDQVKIRGYRVELSEIEAAIGSEPGVAAAAAVLRPVAEIEQLVAFIVPSAEGAVHVAELRRGLAARLPPYMVPGRFEIMPELPRLTSGKIDRKVLRSMPLQAAAALNSEEDADARNEDEDALYAAVRILFPGQALREDFDFFDDLGGHSLLVARLVSSLRANPFYATLSIQDVYRERRLEAIAVRMGAVRTKHEAAVPPPRSAVPWQRRWLCGAVQAAIIPWLMLIHIASWLMPFFVYHYFTGDEGDSLLGAACYSVVAFLLTEISLFPLAIVGKWIVAGRLKAGRYPLWGFTYFRWWLADRLCELPPVNLLTGTPALCWFLRALGAKIGRDVIIDSAYIRAPDLITIEDGASLGTGVHCANARVEQGTLILGPIHFGREATIDSYVALYNDTSVGDGARLGGLSALTAGQTVPEGQNWEGAPARRVDRVVEPLPPRPRFGALAKLVQSVFFLFAGMAIATLFFLTIFPGFILIDWVDANSWDLFENQAHLPQAFGLYFLLSIPASLVLMTLTILLAAGLRYLFLPRQQPGTFPIYGMSYCRTRLLNRVLDSSLDLLHGIYASSFASAWLRLMGTKVGRHAEISTAVGITPDLLTLGDDTFIADGVILGDEEQRGGWLVLKPTIIGNRSFVGNGAYVSDGAVLPDDVLIGVQTRTPENDQLQSGQTWMGSPPILLPARETIEGFPERLTFRPSWKRKLGRAMVESMRIVLPLAFVIASGYLIVQIVMPIAGEEEWIKVANTLAFSGMIFGLGSFLLVVALKWILVGRYRPMAAPMWTPFVWLSEAVTNVYESLAVPNFLAHLRGTPLLPWALRILGTKIGRGVYLDTTDLTEFDCVQIGDEAELNAWCGPQTHLFEDRVMKIGRVEIGAQATIGASSTVLYDTVVGDRVRLGPLTLVAKGERLPNDTSWEGSPAGPTEE